MKILFIADPHLPYTRMDLWRKLYDFNRTYKADKVLCAGDFLDQYGLSKYVKNPRGDTSHREILKCIPQVKILKEWFPVMEILPGNHDQRIHKRAGEAGIPDFYFGKKGALGNVFETIDAPEGWTWTKGDRVTYDGTVFTHGWLSEPKKHAEFFNQSCFHGHAHSKAGLVFIKRERRTIFNACVGFMANKNSIALSYGPIKYNTGVEAFGYQTNGVPHVQAF